MHSDRPGSRGSTTVGKPDYWIHGKADSCSKDHYFAKLLSRMKVELTVLGFIAMIIWSSRQCGMFSYKLQRDPEKWSKDTVFDYFPDDGIDMLHVVEGNWLCRFGWP